MVSAANGYWTGPTRNRYADEFQNGTFHILFLECLGQYAEYGSIIGGRGKLLL